MRIGACAALVFALAGCTTYVEPPPNVTRAEYEAVQPGMLYGQVIRVIGAEGEEMSVTEVAGRRTKTYVWKNSLTAMMTGVFVDGEMISKSQFGIIR